MDKHAKQVKKLRILKIADYKGYKILIQQIIPVHMFQCILFKNGQFYQAHSILEPSAGKKRLTTKELVQAGALMLDTAMIMADKIDELDAKINTPSGKNISEMN